MERIRVQVLDMPEMLREIVLQALADESDFEILLPPAEGSSPPEAAARAAPDVVVLALPDGAHRARLDALMRSARGTKFLAFREHGRQAFLYELCPEMVPLGELSPQELIVAIRESTKRSTCRELEASDDAFLKRRGLDEV